LNLANSRKEERRMNLPVVESPIAKESFMEGLKDRLAPLYARLAEHALYRSFHSIDNVRTFMQSHVFAVWDFMSLLKTLQRGLTSVEVPWMPSADASSRRLVNEIVLGEESDVYEGRPVSHFELYLEAMQACGASTSTIEAVLGELRAGAGVMDALAHSGASPAARIFVAETFRVIAGGRLHEIAAAFTFGREDLIPDIFRGFIRDQDEQLSGQLGLFRWYLDRHIEVDGDEHGPMALQMVANLCGSDRAKWMEASDAAVRAVEARLALWDALAVELGR
jgi:hypothetical protein